MNSFAPVLITTLNRYEHFKECVESLAKCTHADKTDLFIAVDYPKKLGHWEGYNKIITYLHSIIGFKSVILIKRYENFGAAKNHAAARKEVYRSYDRIIFSEDDNVFSPNFLDFINNGLVKFNHNDNVYAICGYNYPVELPMDYEYNFYFYRGFSGWGYGTWKSKRKQINYCPADLVKFVSNKNNLKELNKVSHRHSYNILSSILKNENRIGDFSEFLNNIVHNQYCVFPTISKVRNNGHDGSGINCGTKNYGVFASQVIDTNYIFNFEETELPTYYRFNNILKRYFSIGIKGRIRGEIHRILYYLHKNFN